MNPQNKPNITLLLITKNEEENIKKNFDWLEECKSINEIIVVDDNSTDSTKNVLEKLESKERKVKVFSRGLDNNFSSQRSFGLEKTTNNWILWLDADEKPIDDFILFLNDIDLSQYKKAFAFKRVDIFLGHQLNHGETANQHFTRLFNKNHGQFINSVHEIWHSTQPVIDKDLVIYHYSHPTLKSFIQKINFYTEIRAQELLNQKVKTNLFEIIFYPLVKFFQNYFIRLGFLDSTPGIIMALSMSLHSFLVRAKLWQLQQQSSST